MNFRALAVVALFLATPLAAQPPSATPPSAERIREAEEAVAAIDESRLLTDAAYAGTVADHFLVLQAAPGQSGPRRAWVDRAVVPTLAAAGRHDLAEAAADALLRDQPNEWTAYEVSLFAAERAGRWRRAADLVERGIAGLPEATRFRIVPPRRVGALMRELRGAGDRALGDRTAEALLAIGWPGEAGPPAAADWLRRILVERDLERGDVAAARRRAAEVQGIGTVLQLVTDRRFDRLYAGADRGAVIRAAIEREDRATAARLAAAPEDTDRLIERAGFLRSIGRDREVLDLLLPRMSDVRIVAGRSNRGLWLINEAAYSLIATGAAGEAVALMRPLFAMDVDSNPELVNTSINFVGVLWEAGRFEEALESAQSFMAEDVRYATPYGRMWIISSAVCAATDLRRSEEAEAWLARTRDIAQSNPSAMLRALLCRGDLEAAERVMIAALEDEDYRSSAILWLQDYEPQRLAPAAQRLREAFLRLRARPAVAAALAQRGHRLRLPIPAVLYGWY